MQVIVRYLPYVLVGALLGWGFWLLDLGGSDPDRNIHEVQIDRTTSDGAEERSALNIAFAAVKRRSYPCSQPLYTQDLEGPEDGTCIALFCHPGRQRYVVFLPDDKDLPVKTWEPQEESPCR